MFSSETLAAKSVFPKINAHKVSQCLPNFKQRKNFSAKVIVLRVYQYQNTMLGILKVPFPVIFCQTVKLISFIQGCGKHITHHTSLPKRHHFTLRK